MEFSLSNPRKSIVYKITTAKVNDYVCCAYDNDSQLDEVIEVIIYNNNEELRIHYFHPRGPGTCCQMSTGDCDSSAHKKNILKDSYTL